MPDDLEISLLGGVTLKLGGQPISALTSRKATALFIYLACNPQPFAREMLADLLFAAWPYQQAMADLRVLLNRLRPLHAYLCVTRQSIAFNPVSAYSLDTQTLETELTSVGGNVLTPASAARLETALGLYRGDFLAGFHLSDAFGFEEWVIVARERFQQLVLEAMGQLVSYYMAVGQYQAGLKQAMHLLQLDPFHEAAHRQKMTLLAHLGQRAEALAYYQTCRHLLLDELGIEPSAQTTALYERIRAGELDR